MTHNEKRKIYFGIFWTFLIVSFLFFTSLVILMANGYHLNLKTMKLQQTGMFVLEGNQNNVKLKTSGIDKIINLPYRIKRILPGRYEIVLEKENYQTWSNVYELKGGQAIITQNITLYLSKPELINITTTDKAIIQLQNDYKNQINGLTIKDTEILKDNRLVTRFSQPISVAIYDQNTNHVYYQTGDQLRVMESDGANNVLLITLKQNTPTYFVVSKNKLKYLDQSEIFESTIY